MSLLFLVAAFLMGGAIALQAPVNNALAAGLGHDTLSAALVSFVVGTLAVAVIALVGGRVPAALSALPAQPVWTLSGGILGLAYILGSIYLVPRIGLAGMLALVIAGQLACSLTLDHFGLLGLAERRINPVRAIGAAAVMAGVMMVLFGERWFPGD